MASCLICYFIVVLLYIEKKWLLMRNVTTIQICMENFSVLILQMELWKYWKMVKLQKISMKNCKTFCEGQTASRI